MKKTFTLTEAEAAIPQLEKAAAAAVDLRDRAQAKLRAIADLEQKGDHAQTVIERAQAEFLAKSLEGLLHNIELMGASIKGLEPFLIDFPFLLEGRRVWLCWRQGEKNIRHYHGLEEGFAGRRPLPDGLLPS